MFLNPTILEEHLVFVPLSLREVIVVHPRFFFKSNNSFPEIRQFNKSNDFS